MNIYIWKNKIATFSTHTKREKKSHKHSIHEFCAACIRVEIEIKKKIN